MEEKALRTGTPGVRLGLALLVSLVLHVAILLPWPMFQAPARPLPMPPALEATLAAPLLKTRETPPEPELAPPPTPPTLPLPPRAEPPVPTSREVARARPLVGRALDTALAAIAREDFYPREAIERGIEGRVVLLLDLNAAGAVTGVEVASSSGHPLLDAAALRAAGRIGSLPGGRRQVLLPVEFRLD